MPLILAIEPDRRQASKIATLARGPLKADLLVAESTERAIEALAERVPDLILTSALLSPKDEAALADRLRELDASGQHVQTLVIPVFASATGRSRRPGGLLKRLRGKRAADAAPAGCDPAVFAAQIAEYLEKAAADRLAAAAALEETMEDAVPVPWPEPLLQPEPVPEPEPFFRAVPVPEAEPILQPEPVQAAEPIVRAEPVPWPEPILQPEPVREAEPFFRGEPIPEPEPIFQAEPVPEPEPILQPDPVPEAEPFFRAEPVMEPRPIFRAEPVLQLNPILWPVPVMPPEPRFYPEFASTYKASPAAPDPQEEPNQDEDLDVLKRPEEPWQEIVLEEQSATSFGVRASEDFDTDTPSLELTAESIDLAAFVQQLSDSLLAAEQGAGIGRAAESEPSIELEPITFEHAVEEPTAGSERLDGLDGLADDKNEDDAELWMPLTAVVGHGWPHIEGEAAHAASAIEGGLFPQRHVALPEARPAAPIRKTAPSRRRAAPKLETRRKKRQKAAPAPVPNDGAFFDPDECGFAALIAKLDEVTAENSAPVKRRV